MTKVTHNWENWFMTNLQICVCTTVQTLPVPICLEAGSTACENWELSQRQVSGVKANAQLTATSTTWEKTKLAADPPLGCHLPSSPKRDLGKSSFVDYQGLHGPFFPTAPHEKVPSL